MRYLSPAKSGGVWDRFRRISVGMLVLLLAILAPQNVASSTRDGPCTAADMFPPGTRWEQRTPLVDAMFARAASLKPQTIARPQTVKATWTRRTAPDQPPRAECGGDDGRIEIVNKGNLPQHCRLVESAGHGEDHVGMDGPRCPSGMDIEQWARWNATKGMLLPPAHIKIERTSLVVYFSVLPVGAAIVLPCNAKIVCPLVLGFAPTASGPLLDEVVASEFEIDVRSSQAEVALVTQELSFLSSVLSSGGGVHRGASSSGADPAPNADINELDINRQGLRLRVSLTGDAFRIPLTDACVQHLGHAAQYVSHTDVAPEGMVHATVGAADDASHPLLRSLCLRERSEGIATVKASIAAAFTCAPLPCLHVNPVFNVSHLAIGGLSETEAMDPRSISGGYMWVQSAASHAVRILDVGDAATEAGISAKVQRVVAQWRSAVAPTTTPADATHEQTLRAILAADDVVVLQDTYAEVFVDAETLRRRGFALPDVRQINWWCRYARQHSPTASTALCDAIDEDSNGFAEAWRKAMGVLVRQPSKGAGRFEIAFHSANIPTHKAAVAPLDPSNVHRFSQLKEALDGKGTCVLLDAMDTDKLPPRGAKSLDRTVPYVSTRYQVAHPQHDNLQWPRMDGNAFVPLTWNCIAGANRTESCPMRFGVVAPYLVHGFELVLNADSPEELLLRHNSAFLVCPPSVSPTVEWRPNEPIAATRCGSAYYGVHEAPLSHWFRRHWIKQVRIDPTYRRLLLFDWGGTASPTTAAHVDGALDTARRAWEAFGKPIYVALRLPAGTVDDDMQFPMPLAGDDNVAAGHLYGFVVLPDDTAHHPEGAPHPSDEL